MFWPFLRKGTTAYTQQCEIWGVTSLGTMIRFRKNKFKGPFEDHVLAIKGHVLAISRNRGYRIRAAMQNLALNIPEYNY